MKLLNNKEREAYDYVIRANNEYFERINKARKFEDGSDEFVAIIADTIENAGKYFAGAEVMLDKAIESIEDDERKQLFVDLQYGIQNCREDLANLVFKSRGEMALGDNTIEECISRFEEGIEELQKE